MPRVRSIGQAFQVAKQQTIEATHRLLVTTAKREHAKVMAAEPRPTSFHRIVDGVPDAPEESARPHGTIIYRYPRIEAVVQFAMDTLFDLSPVRSGTYRRSHMIFIDQAGASDLKGWAPGMEIMIMNPTPYARKIEVGGMKMRVPGSDLVYQQARRKIAQRYGNQVNVVFTYRALLGASPIAQEKAASSGKGGQLGADGVKRSASGMVETRAAKKFGKFAHNRSGARFPSIVITER